MLEELRADPASTDASRVQLWAEHFDAAFEALPEESQQRRAGFGASPGDAANPEPYLYVVPWCLRHVTPSERWNAESFRGAILPYAELLARARPALRRAGLPARGTRRAGGRALARSARGSSVRRPRETGRTTTSVTRLRSVAATTSSTPPTATTSPGTGAGPARG